jgi:hypothetical protein
MPCALTSTVEPSVALDATFTTDAAVLPLAGDVVGAVEAAVLLDVLLELLPHAAISSEAASVGRSNFVDWRMRRSFRR